MTLTTVNISGRTKSRIIYTPTELTAKVVRAAMIVIEYMAPDSMTTIRIGVSWLEVAYSEVRCFTLQMRYASRPARRVESNITTKNAGRTGTGTYWWP